MKINGHHNTNFSCTYDLFTIHVLSNNNVTDPIPVADGPSLSLQKTSAMQHDDAAVMVSPRMAKLKAKKAKYVLLNICPVCKDLLQLLQLYV